MWKLTFKTKIFLQFCAEVAQLFAGTILMLCSIRTTQRPRVTVCETDEDEKVT